MLQDFTAVTSSSSEYKQLKEVRDQLPAAKQLSKIIKEIESRQVVIITGEPGSGKSTQIPQAILDHFIINSKGGDCNIVCTQPRRISAIGVAERVAEERCEPIGKTVGYQIRLESKKGRNTKLLYCTTGILLRKLQTNANLNGFSHVIVDEVHERSVEIDFLLIV